MVYGRKCGGNGEVGAAGAAVSHGGVAGGGGKPESAEVDPGHKHGQLRCTRRVH